MQLSFLVQALDTRTATALPTVTPHEPPVAVAPRPQSSHTGVKVTNCTLPCVSGTVGGVKTLQSLADTNMRARELPVVRRILRALQRIDAAVVLDTFLQRDLDGSGAMPVSEFEDTMTQLRYELLWSEVEAVVAIYGIGVGDDATRQINYSELLRDMDPPPVCDGRPGEVPVLEQVRGPRCAPCLAGARKSRSKASGDPLSLEYHVCPCDCFVLNTGRYMLSSGRP